MARLTIVEQAVAVYVALRAPCLNRDVRRKNMIRNYIPMLLAILAISGSVANADMDDGTLRDYLNKSELVVVGNITRIIVITRGDAAAPEYTCTFQIDDVIKPHPLQTNSTIMVNIKRFELGDEDRHPLLAEGKQSILFLKRTYDKNAWDTVDYWFGIQEPLPILIRTLKRLVKESVEQAGPAYPPQGVGSADP